MSSVLQPTPLLLSQSPELIVKDNNYGIRVLEFNLPKVQWLWEQMNKFRTLFSDITAGDIDNYVNLVTLPNSLWYEIVRLSDNEVVGVLYVTDIQPTVDATMHVMFFDRVFKDKIALCREFLLWVMRGLQLHRASAVIPDIYHATIRFAENIGFVREGTRRQSLSIGGKWRDEILLGILISET